MSEEYLPTTPVPVNQSTTPLDVIETTQKIRLKVTEKLLEKGIPDDRREIRMLTEVLRDMDTNALTARKLEVEEKAVDQASVVSKNVADILSVIGHGVNPFMTKAPVAERVIVDDSHMLPPVAEVPGNTFQGVEQLNYDDFVNS